MMLLAQITSRVFVGEQLCRDATWLQVLTNYTTHAFIAEKAVRPWPRFLVPLVWRMLKPCRETQAEFDKAQRIIHDAIKKRKSEPHLVFSDVMQWAEETAGESGYNPVVVQLAFSGAAISTSTDFLTQLIVDLCEDAELVDELRAEAAAVIMGRGWGKDALHELKLMDSVMKESQRLKPLSLGLQSHQPIHNKEWALKFLIANHFFG